MWESWGWRVVFAFLLGIIGFFVKRLISKGEAQQGRIETLERKNIVLTKDIVALNKALKLNGEGDAKQGLELKELKTKFYNSDRTVTQELNNIGHRLGNQNALLLIIARQLKVGDTAEAIINGK